MFDKIKNIFSKDTQVGLHVERKSRSKARIDSFYRDIPIHLITSAN